MKKYDDPGSTYVAIATMLIALREVEDVEGAHILASAIDWLHTEQVDVMLDAIDYRRERTMTADYAGVRLKMAGVVEGEDE